MTQKNLSIIGMSLVAIMFALVAVQAIPVAEANHGGSLGQRIRACIEQRRDIVDNDDDDDDLTREERRAIRQGFRTCIRNAIRNMHGSSSSRSISSSSSISSSRSSISSSGSSLSSSRSSSSSSRRVVRQVDIEDFEYDPSPLSVKVGTTVVWENEDEAPHTVTSMTGTTLNSGRLDEDEEYSFTFTSAGTYDYFCTFHPEMKGRVIVTP